MPLPFRVFFGGFMQPAYEIDDCSYCSHYYFSSQLLIEDGRRDSSRFPRLTLVEKEKLIGFHQAVSSLRNIGKIQSFTSNCESFDSQISN
jgi:hypothetical protein